LVKLPAPPPAADLVATGADIVAVAHHTVLWRVYRTAGRHPRAWDAFRRFGPVASCRFDPHLPPPREQDEGVLYTALDVPTVLAECFQVERAIDTGRGSPHLIGFRPRRTLRLLDLTATWPIRAGASHVINTGRRDVTRQWARAIRQAWPDLDGLWHTSSMTAAPCVTLWNPAENAVPHQAAFDRPLSHPSMTLLLAKAGLEIGYRLI
jgi:hypothetical protein